MLNLIFQKRKAKGAKHVYPDSRSVFELHKKVEWFEDPFVQKIMKEVNKVTLVKGFVLETESGVAIPPEYLSTGTKTAICIYKMPDCVFNLTQMEDKLISNKRVTFIDNPLTTSLMHLLKMIVLSLMKPILHRFY